MQRASAILLLLIVTAFSLASGEEERQYTLEYRVEPVAIYTFDLIERTKTIVQDPTTGSAVIFALSSYLDNSYVTMEQNGAWIRYASQRVFKDTEVDEATSNGLELPKSEIEKQKESELISQRMNNSVFDFGVITENGSPDTAAATNEIQSVINYAAGNIVFITPVAKCVGDEWGRKFKVADYTIDLVYNFEKVETVEGHEIAFLKGGLKFVGLENTDPLSVMKAFVFELKLDLVRKTAVESELNAVYSIKKDNQLITRQITLVKKLKSMRKQSADELKISNYESDLLKTAQKHEQSQNFSAIPAELEDILARGKSLFNDGIMVFLRDHVFPYQEVMGKKVTRFWFTDWLNCEAMNPTSLVGRVVLIAFFDPDIASSTRIWRPWEDWSTHFAPKGLTLIAASSAKKETTTAYLKDMDLKHAVAIDGNFMMLNLFKVGVLPTFVLLDKEGKVCFVLVGRNELFKLHKKLEEFFGPIE